MKVTKRQAKELRGLINQLYETYVEYYHLRENKTYIAKGKLKRSNIGFERKGEAAASLKAGQLENSFLLSIRAIAASHAKKSGGDVQCTILATGR